MKAEQILRAFRNPTQASVSEDKVYIIGAGIAGLTAAKILQNHGQSFQILEASNRVGGRIYSYPGLYPHAVELGAEEIHGDRSAWYQLVQDHGFSLMPYEDEFEELYELENGLVDEDAIATDPDLLKAIQFVEYLDRREIQKDWGPSVLDYLKASPLPKRVHHLVKAWLSGEYGTSLPNIDLKSLQDAARKWSSGHKNFILPEASYQEVVDKIFSSVYPAISFKNAVNRVDYSSSGVRLLAAGQESYFGRACICTVPLAALQSGFITWIPTLPSKKLIALHNLSQDTGTKIILRFRSRFWPEDTGSIYTRGWIPEFYTSAKDQTPILTAYIMGEPARKLAQLPGGALAYALQELDRLFGNKIASKTFQEEVLYDWSQDSWIQGAFSYPGPGAEAYREGLAEPIAKQIFFAGEATHNQGHAATVHGALETGFRAAMQVLGKKIH